MTLRIARFAAAAVALALATSGLCLADRVWDNEVKRLIDYTNRGLNDFRKAARSDFKNSKITWNGTTIDVGSYLTDTVDAGKKLASRYNENYAAVPEATDFLKRLRNAEEFAAANPGISGAKAEWDLLRPNAVALAKAYGIDYAADPATWNPMRTPDGPIRATAASIENQTKAFGKTLDGAAKTAGLDKSRRKVLEGQSETALTAAKNVRAAVDGSRPAGPALDSLGSALSDLGTTVDKDGLSGAVASAWTPIQDSVAKLADLLN